MLQTKIKAGINLSSISLDGQQCFETSWMSVPDRMISELLILHSLASENMHCRFDQVEDAHFDTFDGSLKNESMQLIIRSQVFSMKV